MSFLAKLSQLKKLAPRVEEKSRKKDVGKEDKSKIIDPLKIEGPLFPKHYVREEDPAIKRLKELRRKEQLKNAAALGKKTPAPASRKKKDESTLDTETKFRRKAGESTKIHRPVKAVVREPIKKLSFDELMKQAEEKATSPPKTLSGNGQTPRPAPRVPFKQAANRTQKEGFRSKFRQGQRDTSHPRKADIERPTHKQQRPPVSKPSIAQPNAKLRKKLDIIKQRRQSKHHESDDGEDLDDFIEDDDEEQDYNRDEIWAMFNKGKRRRDFGSDDESDMEANEMEILEEEEHAAKMARLEDKKEEQWLKKHEQQKRKKLGKP
ncbi:LANO_0C05468g1_1 [Lachancea nothofagi CBS 11611]|uniref:LANO_0C05468g1_1 n=1 Tax=Lachancea nothofagi CBS 11611 TaxID=1266666 RepID=A0A1G4J7R4_9SACH|nr:LANO_0C05468g1_1 [Lachancea nothofagi CBS 11611]